MNPATVFFRTRPLWPAVLAAAATAQQPPLQLHALFGDHMVLPQGGEVTVPGRTEPGATVELSAPWLDAPVRASAGGDGAFRLSLPTPAPGGPFAVELRSSGGALLRLQDVLVGDVWLGSGQSNMQMPVGVDGSWRSGTVDWQREVATADLPELRLFTVTRRTAAAPLQELDGEWQVCTPAVAQSFSATAWFFGRELQHHRQQPLGLVVSCWGGTPCEAWTRAEGLSALPEFAPDLELLAAAARGEDPLQAQRTAFWGAVDALDPAIKGRHPWDAAFNDADWMPVEQPHRWSQGGVERHDGIGWYRRIVTIPDEWAGRDLLLMLGPIDDMDRTWFAGAQVGATELMGSWQQPRQYQVPGTLVAAGPVAIAVRVVDTGGEGGFCGTAEAMRLQPAAGEQGAIDLSGKWTFWRGAELTALPPFPAGVADSPHRASVLWNGMIAPLCWFPFRGVLWYQGESNWGRSEQYASLFPAMIRDWRRAFGSDQLPFLFVQIAPFGYGGDHGELFRLRLAQEQALALPHTGMVASTDVGDPRDIHPRNKRAIGERLARLALAQVHGDGSVAWQSPRPRRALAQDGALRLEFTGADGGLHAGAGGPRHFEVAGADGVFHPADASIDGSAVVLRSDAVAAPRQARYCHDATALADLFNARDLPGVPFLIVAGN